MSDPNFIVLHCPFNFLRIFKDGAHRSKTEFKLGPCSGVNLTCGTGWFVYLPYTNIHASHSQFSKYPSLGVNLIALFIFTSTQSQFENLSRDTVPLSCFSGAQNGGGMRH